jgi:antitoxin HicB
MNYPFIIQKSKRNYAAVAEQFGILVTATTRGDLEQKMADSLADYLFEMRVDGKRIPKPVKHDDIDVSDFEGEWFEIVGVEPSTTNPLSLKLAKAVKESGLTQGEVAKRMGTTQSVVSRFVDPFYFGHTVKSLERFASVVGRELEINLPKAA